MKPYKLSYYLFWSSMGLIFYVYIGFPVVLAIRKWLRPQPLKGETSGTPLVSMIIVAHNEADVIRQKLDNALALDYPRSCLEIVVASDGSDDGTDELVQQYNVPEVRLLTQPRQGKNLTLNAAVNAARGDILFFTDADSMLAPSALRHLVAPFSDRSVGGVVGDYRYPTDVKAGEGERAYWSFDRMWRRLQSQSGSLTSAIGQIYAIRRSLFKPVPLSVTDDFFTSVQVPSAHHRLVFEPQALAYGPIAPSAQAEFRRKVRVITRGLRSVWENRHLLNPFEYGFYAIQVFTHKLLRRLMVIPLLLTFITAPLLWSYGWFYKLATLGQVSFHTLAVAGFLLREQRISHSKLLSLPLYFDLVYTAAAMALINLIRGKRYDVWAPERSKVEQLTEIGK